jgi:SNF2 family DNA or RNA helicase
MIQLRDYQKVNVKVALDVLKVNEFVYLAMEVRTGKTLTSLSIADKIGKNVLFVTKKKAISSIQKDYELLKPGFSLLVINYESLHKLPKDSWDVVILDEAHSMGAFPKPSKRAKQVKELIRKQKCKVILLSGTPSPESYSQMYHQVYGIPGNPFSEYKNFYRFCDDHVNVTSRKINGFDIKDYSGGKKEILDIMKPYTIAYTQAEAGFESKIEEEILTVRMRPITYSLCSRLKKDQVIEGVDEVILADTGVKMMTKLHQMYSGTVKFESGNSKIIDTTKAEFIRDKFSNNKIGVFYKFKEELNALMEVFGDDLCTQLDHFDVGDYKVIALQIVSGREGISLRNADFIVFYNIDFSATSYWQARDRMTTKDRKINKVYWIFSEKGIERDIYKAVSQKKNYTLSHFKRDLLSL